MRETARLLLLAAMVLATPAGAELFDDDFDEEPADGGSPNSYSVYGHEVMDRGVTTQTSKSGNQSAYVIANFSMDKWGVILLHDFGDWDLRNGTLHVSVRASTSFSSKEGVVGFKLVDADGTGYRTSQGALFKPTMSWKTFSQPVSELVKDDETGEDPELDLEHIAQYGVVFYDRGDVEKMVNFFIDDIKVTK
jgi:hypothetical protein